MRQKRSPEEQIEFCLRQHESATPVTEIIRELGISGQTFYRWKKKYSGMVVAEVRKSLEEENKKLKQSAADPSLDKKMLPFVLRKGPALPFRQKSSS